MNSVSVIITSSHEPQTIGKALLSILNQDSSEILEILVVAPDEKTLEAARKTAANHQKIKFVKDPGQGKPTALNLALKKVKGEILVLTDGDVEVAPQALSHLLEPFGFAQGMPFSDSKVGGSCGRPIPINNRNTILGFWSYFLTDSAHQIRLIRSQNNQFIELSGYLLAIRKSLISPIPPNTLADDSYLSHLIAKAKFKTAYVPEAKVFVKYPTNLSDWFKQKRRSTFEFWQKEYLNDQSMRSPLKEAWWGLKFAKKFPKNLKEIFWLSLLFLARIILWLQIFFLSLFPSFRKKLWVRIESTKEK